MRFASDLNILSTSCDVHVTLAQCFTYDVFWGFQEVQV